MGALKPRLEMSVAFLILWSTSRKDNLRKFQDTPEINPTEKILQAFRGKAPGRATKEGLIEKRKAARESLVKTLLMESYFQGA